MRKTISYQDEFALMQNFSKGERAAFDQIYRSLHFRIYDFAHRFLRSGADAEDITADAFVKLWQKRTEFGSVEHIRTFLFTATKNACINFLKHGQVKDSKHTDILKSLLQSQRTDFYLEEIKEELMKHIYAEVEKLPARMKEIFLLSYKEGLKPAEIAKQLNLSVQTVSNQKSTALHILKTALGHNTILLAMLLFPQHWTA